MKNSLFYLLLIFLIAGCGTNQTTEAQNTDKTAEVDNPKTENPVQIPNNSKLPPAKPIDPTFFTYDNWKVDRIVTSDEDRERMFTDVTFDISADGYFKILDAENEVKFQGVIRYDQPKDLIQFHAEENDDNWSKSEWKIQYNGSMLVFTGTPTFRDNGMILLMHKAQ